MSESEESERIELARYHGEIVTDLRHLLNKYLRIMEWDVPDVDDEKKARGLVVQALKAGLAEVEAAP